MSSKYKKISGKAVILATFAYPIFNFLLKSVLATKTSSNFQLSDNQISKMSEHNELIGVIVESISITISGYLAAWIAKHDDILNAILSSVIVFMCSLMQSLTVLGLFLAHEDSGTTLVVQIILLLKFPVLAGFGGYIHLIQKRYIYNHPRK